MRTMCAATARESSQPTGQREHKLVMVGLDNADKTTILYQFLMNEVVHTSDRIERGRGTHAVYQITSGHFVSRSPVTGVHLPRFSFIRRAAYFRNVHHAAVKSS
ncbi:uncharacterized protein LOC128273341 [Anopheles cruzii]|uniref:uncharacterized protein LOC128273341 n=1 Tax=Anopheles cruzii TaxID=68878 RepID=UPI0022EC8351|nr:uncharacterized protein LOC128273341 [Anopheles cruzii]